jgi:uncharacterized repeat protein (TIGR03806 family)
MRSNPTSDRVFLPLCLAAALVATGLACGGTEIEPVPEPELPYETLSQYGFFVGPLSDLAPAEGVVPYAVRSPLFSDYALKERFIVVPDGEAITYRDDAPWEFPPGTIIIKNFGYADDLRDPDGARRILETRILVLGEDGWTPWVYVWNEAQDDAVLEIAGAVVPVSWLDEAGERQDLDYRVPNTNQCGRCHGEAAASAPLGVHTRQLDRDGQIEAMQAAGLFVAPPPVEAERARFAMPGDEAAPIAERARAYLDANCAHCHSSTGAAASTGLYLRWQETDPSALGVCRVPFAGGPGTGGRLWDVVPGAPDESVMVYRMESNEVGIMMPELPNQLVDPVGIALVRGWIEGMEAGDCQ